MRLVTVLSTFIVSLAAVKDVLAAVPSGAITVGSGGKYSTLAAALADTSSNVYYVYSGTYTGQVAISRSNVVIYGETSTSGSYTGNTVTFTDGVTAADAGSNDASGTVRVLASGVKLYNLNIYNTYGTSSSHVQAIALSVQAGSFGCYGCKITGYQDTLLANVGTQVYAHSYISGGVDFIFGMSASIWITQSVIDTLGSGCITASGRSSDDSNYYVIDSSTIQGSGSQYLGRPWRDYARVIYQNCNIGSNIVAAGWSVWQSTDTRTDHVTYGEYNNVGAGAWNSGRASFATLLTSPISITTVLGSGYTSWVDTSYLSASVATTSTTTKASSTSTSKTSSTTKATSTSSTKATSTSSTKATTSSTTSTTKVSSSSTKTTSSSASSGTGAALYGQCGGLTWTGPTTCASGTCTYSNGKFDTRQRYTMNTNTYHRHSSMNIDTYRLLDYYSQCTP